MEENKDKVMEPDKEKKESQPVCRDAKPEPDCLNIRYVKLHFELTFPEDSQLPSFKSSALRGGIGEMLLRANCIRDRNCEACDFREECIVQRTMYSRFDQKPEFLTSGDSVGYVLNCENYQEFFPAGSTLSFTLTLFGTTIVYFNEYMQALYALGQNGLGKEHARFYISNVTNSEKQQILEGNTVYMRNYRIQTVRDYVRRRIRSFHAEREQHEMVFHTPLTQKYQGEFLRKFDMEAIIQSIQRRIYILDAFEGFDTERFYRSGLPVPELTDQSVRLISVNRYSNRKNMSMPLRGIKGTVSIQKIPEETIPYLLAGELLHIGKNTSFGYGGYKIY